jgi:hypothetical protein
MVHAERQNEVAGPESIPLSCIVAAGLRPKYWGAMERRIVSIA